MASIGGQPAIPARARAAGARLWVQAIDWMQTRWGRAALLLVFAGFLIQAWERPQPAIVAVLAAAACAYLPGRRPQLLAAAGLLMLVFQLDWYRPEVLLPVLRAEGFEVEALPAFSVAALMAFFAATTALLYWASRHPASVIVRRPLLSLLSLVAVVTGLAASPLLHGASRVALWSALLVLCAYLWFLAYALADQRSRDRSPLLFQLGCLHPFWGSSTTPIGKGAAYLRKTHARDPVRLAETQLRGLKLLVWACVLSGLSGLLDLVATEGLGLTAAEALLHRHAEGLPVGRMAGWAALIWATAHAALALAVWGHQIVAVARLAGFALARNSYRPLESTTLAEFWNRYYFYFKELLVELFFLPTFLRTAHWAPRWRLFFATFMAAGVGNALFHFLKDIGEVARVGLWPALQGFQSYLFYCLMLSLGIGISQARQAGGARSSSRLGRRLAACAGVWFIVVCLHIFGNESRAHSLGERLAFMFHLFALPL